MVHDRPSFPVLGSNRKVLVLALLAGVFLYNPARAQQAQPRPADQVAIRTVNVAPGFYVLTGRGTNTSVAVGDDGVVLVNGGFAQAQPQLVEAVAKITAKPIRYLINTDWHDPNTSANTLMAKLGATIVAHDNVRKRLSAERFDPGNTKQQIPPYPKEGLPAVTYSTELTLHLNGEDVYVFHPANAHSDSDSMVYFPKSNVLSTGDIYYSNNWPLVDLPSNGSVNGVIGGLDWALKIVNGGTKVVPGRGPITTTKDLTEYRSMFVTVRDRVLTGIRAGKTLDEVLAAKPTAEFEEAKKGTGELVVTRTGADVVKWFYKDLSKTTAK